MKSRFYINQWLKLKPKNYSGKTDIHYLKIANTIYSCLDHNQKSALHEFMDKDEIIVLCCFITCYYEDVISQTNIWQSFKKLYCESYNKSLPFYNLDADYIADEINVEDVTFLLWYYINTIQSEKFVNPYHNLIIDIAKQFMQILDEDYEFAPENEVLKNIYKFDLSRVADSDEFYKTREYLQKFFFECYLFYPDIKRRLDKTTLETIEELTDEEPHMIMSYLREISDDYTFNKSSALLALNSKDWVNTVLGQSNTNYNAILSLSKKVQGLFQYKSQSETDITLEHIASEMLFKMTKKSFDSIKDLKIDDIIYIGLVQYNDEWWFSGNFITQPFDANLILDQKNSAEARSQVNFLENKQQVELIIKKQKQAFLDFNGGSLITFLSSADLNPFLNDYYNFYNDSLKFTDKEKIAAAKRAKSEGYFGEMNDLEEQIDNEDLFVVFFNPISGIEFYDDIVNAFPDERNPFFSGESHEDVQHILMSDVCSTEFTNYFIEHYKDQLEYFKIEPYKSYLNDLDFLLKFWKKDNYITKNTMILTG